MPDLKGTRDVLAKILRERASTKTIPLDTRPHVERVRRELYAAAMKNPELMAESLAAKFNQEWGQASALGVATDAPDGTFTAQSMLGYRETGPNAIARIHDSAPSPAKNLLHAIDRLVLEQGIGASYTVSYKVPKESRGIIL